MTLNSEIWPLWFIYVIFALQQMVKEYLVKILSAAILSITVLLFYPCLLAFFFFPHTSEDGCMIHET